MNVGKNRGESPSPRLSLGSWHIFSRLSLEEGATLVRAALDRGIVQFDIGDYWDHELKNTVRFREIMKVIGRPRGQYVVSVKLFTNSAVSRADLLRQELDLLGLEQVDYVICSRPAANETLEQAVEAMGGLVQSGLARNLAVGLWEAKRLIEAERLFKRAGLAPPKFIQYQYNLCRRTVVDSEDFRELFASTDIKLQAAFTLEGGLLAGHLHRRRYDEADRDRGEWFTDRNIARDSGGIQPRMRQMAPQIAAAAQQLGVSPARFAMAFAATHPSLDTLLFGATKVWQLDEAVAALELARTRREEVRKLAELFEIQGAKQPTLFDQSVGHR